MESIVSRDTVERAVQALLKWKDLRSKNSKPQLIPEDDFVYLNIALKKIPPKSRTNPFKVPLPHPLHDPFSSSELCLIIDDRPSSNLTSEGAKKLIKSQNIPISKVIKLSKLKTNYKPFEAKRKLCDSYDLFLVDRRVVHLLPKLLGKQFFKKKKLPLPLDLTHKNWKEQIERACVSGLLYLRTGTCSVMRVGKLSMESEEIAENVVAAINGAVKVIPKKWGGVRSLHLKFSDSLALPLYQALPDVKLKIATAMGVKETEVEEATARDSEAELKKEVSDNERRKGKKKNKGRILEVRYMDIGSGGNKLVDEDDEDDNEENENENKEHRINKFSGEQEVKKVSRDEKEEQNENEALENDGEKTDNFRQKRKKVRSVDGRMKKVRQAVKGEKKMKKKNKI